MKTWEQMIFERSALMHMEVLVQALGKQTDADEDAWRESVVPVLRVLVGYDVEGFATAVDYLYAIYSAPDEWVRADEFDALLTRRAS